MKFAVLSILTIVPAFLVGSAQATPAAFRWDWRTAEWPEEALETATLPKPEKIKIREAISRVLRHYIQEDTERRLREQAAATRIKIVDLTGDGVPEIIAGAANMASGCSPTGNCPFWIFAKKERGYVSILDGFGQSFTIVKTKRRRKDIVVAMHSSATRKELSVYRFQSGAYARVGCYEAKWPLIDDKGATTREPRISQCGAR